MCHTLLQHYIPCTHTDLTFIPCDDPDWYPTHGDDSDGLTIEWRDHGQRRGVAHSYERKCPECLRREWKAARTERERRALESWWSWGAGDGVASDSDEDGQGTDAEDGVELVESGRASTRRVDRVLSEMSYVTPPATLPASSPQRQVRQPRDSSAWNELADWAQYSDLCENRVAESLVWFPGLEDWSLEAVDEVVGRFFAGQSLPRLEMGTLSDTTVSEDDVLSISTELLMRVISDARRSGRAVWGAVKWKLRHLLVACQSARGLDGFIGHGVNGLQVDVDDAVEVTGDTMNARLIFEWLVVLIGQHKVAYEQLGAVEGPAGGFGEPNRRRVLYVAWEKYKNITRDGSRAVVWNAVVDAIGSTRQHVPRASRSPNLDPGGREISAIPETVVASVPGVTLSSSLPPAARVPRPPQRELASDPRISCNDPTHAGHTLKQISTAELLASKRHGDHPMPYRHKEVAGATKTFDVLLRFGRCGHFNAINIAQLELSAQGGIVASCGCREFPEQLLMMQRGFSLRKCLVCRWVEVIQRGNDNSECVKRWKDICFERQIRMVTSTREVDLWPFGAIVV